MKYLNPIKSLELTLLYILPTLIIILFFTHNLKILYIWLYIIILTIAMFLAIFSDLAKQHIVVSLGIMLIFIAVIVIIFSVMKYIYPKFTLILNGKYHLILIYVPIITGIFGLLWGTIPPLIKGYFKSIYFALKLKKFTYNPISITFYNGIITMLFVFGISLVIVIYITPIWFLSKVGFTIINSQ